MKKNPGFPPVMTLVLSLLLAWLLGACSPEAAGEPTTATGVTVTIVVPSPESEATAAATSAPVTEPSASPTATPEGLSLESLGPVETYWDSFAGLALDYPADWYLLAPPEGAQADSVVYSASLVSFQPEEAGTEGIPPGETKLDLVIFNEPVDNLEAAVARRKADMAQNEPAEEVSGERDWMLPGDILARRWHITSAMGEAEQLVTVINDRMVLLSGLGDPEIFDAIARTLRPLGE